MPLEERSITLRADDRPTVGMLYAPAEPVDGPVVVLCNAFGDERKSSCLAMVRLARAIAQAGLPALRFDYWGCGDSPGEFIDATAHTRLADVAAAIEGAKRLTDREAVCLVGLRLGAALAAVGAQGRDDVAGLALIEAIPDGGAYVGSLVRRKMVRQMMTSGQAKGEGAEGEEIVDLDGYALRRGTVEGMSALRIADGAVTSATRVLIVQVSFNEKIKRETAAVQAVCEAAGAGVELRTLVSPPFWSRVDIVDTSPLNEAVVEWLGATSESDT